MIAGFLIALREGLEAALIIGIVLSFLKKTGQTRYRRYAWAGVGAALLVSVAVAAALQLVGARLEGQAEELFEGVMMLVAVAVLTWMIFWMRYQARTLKGSIESELATAVNASSPRGLFAVTFFAVVREGIETALLMTATAMVTDGAETLAGTGLGLIAAALIGYLVYASVVRLNIRMFFNVTSVLLLMFAAGLLAGSIHEFQEAGVLFTVQEHVWDINSVLDENSTVGQILKALFGYNGNPSLEEVLGYAAYWVFALLAMPRLVERRVSRNRTQQSVTLQTA